MGTRAAPPAFPIKNGGFIVRKIIFIVLAMVMLVSVIGAGADTARAAASIKVGDVIKFGRYDWRVLEIRGNRALLLSDKIIGKRRYHEYSHVTWETSSLRRYLNSPRFIIDNFSEREEARIEEVRAPNKDNPWYGTKGGNVTVDKIFLLSLEDVVKYFGDSGQLRNRPSKERFIYDRNNSRRIALDTNGTPSWWWLRSPGGGSNLAAFVSDGGSVYVSGDLVNSDSGGVRPALWLNL